MCQIVLWRVLPRTTVRRGFAAESATGLVGRLSTGWRSGRVAGLALVPDEGML